MNDALIHYLRVELPAQEEKRRRLALQAEREKLIEAELEEERQRRNTELEKGIDFEWKSNADPEPAMSMAKLTETVQIGGTDRERISQLHCLIWRAYQHLLSKSGKVTAQQVWDEIRYRHKNHDEDEIIQEVTHELIEWCSRQGNEQNLKRSSFDKTLSNLKANPPF